jgi:hypothetical protein
VPGIPTVIQREKVLLPAVVPRRNGRVPTTQDGLPTDLAARDSAMAGPSTVLDCGHPGLWVHRGLCAQHQWPRVVLSGDSGHGLEMMPVGGRYRGWRDGGGPAPPPVHRIVPVGAYLADRSISDISELAAEKERREALRAQRVRREW